MDAAELHKIHDTLVSVAFEAGRMILAANPSDIEQGSKLNSTDIVTETDQAVERLVSSRLSSRFPDFLFVGEETYQPGVTKITDAPTFIVDPIDGTTNFVHGFPHACISLGFSYQRTPAVGVVYNPFLDILYTGIRGHGGFVQRNASLPPGSGQGPKIKLGPKPPLQGLGAALVGVEWGSLRDGENFELKARTFRALAASRESGGSMVHSLRSLGSAALNLCAVAAGQLDLYWEGGCYAWDVAAGWCILNEAGGIMVSGNPDGNWNPELDSRIYLAIRPAQGGQKEIVEEFWAVLKGGMMEYKH